MKVVKAAAVQLSPVLCSREGTVDKVVQKIHCTSDYPASHNQDVIGSWHEGSPRQSLELGL